MGRGRTRATPLVVRIHAVNAIAAYSSGRRGSWALILTPKMRTVPPPVTSSQAASAEAATAIARSDGPDHAATDAAVRRTHQRPAGA